MSQRDRDRLLLLHQVEDRLLTVSEGARRARLGRRQFRRLLRRFEVRGDAAVRHAARGRRPNNAQPVELRQQALARAHEPL